MGTVMGETQACAISTVAWFFDERRVPQIAARDEQASEWITIWRGFNVDARRRIRKVWRKKAPILANDPRRWNQATGPICATICLVLEAGWKPSTVSGKRQVPTPFLTAHCSTKRRSSTVSLEMWKCKHGKERLGTRSVQVWRKVSLPILPRRPGLSLSEKFSLLRVHWTFLFVEPSTSPLSCGWFLSQSVFLRALRPEDLGHQETRIVGMFRQQLDQSHTHMKESDHFVTLAQEFWDSDQVLFALGLLPCDWLLVNEFAECLEARMWESSGVNECANNNLLVASDGSVGSRDTLKRLRQVASGVGTSSMQTLSGTSFVLQRIGILGARCQADGEPSFGEPSKSPAESTESPTFKLRLMRSV